MLQFVNDITRFLDALSFADRADSHFRKHYVYRDETDYSESILAIRLPGSTVGDIELDENNVIVRIRLFGNPCLIQYSDDVVNQVNEKFAGSIYDFSKDKYKYAK